MRRNRAGLGARIRALRLRRRWTQEQLAEALGRSVSQVKKYECGMHVPPVEKLLHLASLLGVSLEELLLGNPPPDLPGRSQYQHLVALIETFRRSLTEP